MPRLLAEEHHVLPRGVEEGAVGLAGRLERLGELPLLLVAPGALQAPQARVESGEEAVKLVVEAVEFLGESPELGGVDNGFGHGRNLLGHVSRRAARAV